MIRKEEIIADMHTHTVASKHAFSTLKENIDEARNKGIKYIAVTDHFFHNGNVIENKNEMGRICYVEEVNKHLKDIYVVGGAEFNIEQASIDFSINWKKLGKLRWRPIGIHTWFCDVPHTTFDELYEFYEDSTAFHNAFVHIERELFKIDNKSHMTLDKETKDYLEKIVLLAKEKDIFLELNESSILTNECGGVERIKYWLLIAKENKNKIYLGSDAHFCLNVGDFSESIKILNEFDYPRDLILNINEDMIKKTLNL